MSIELTFKSVCTTIKKHGKDDPKLIEAVDNLLGLTIICSPAVLGAPAALLPTLAVKNELVRIGKSVFDKLTKKKDEDYLLRHETMRTTYGLLVFTSFFDALDSCISEEFRKEIGLLENEKAFIATEAVKKSSSHKKIEHPCEVHETQISTAAISFPHPTETLSEQCQRQRKLWKHMSQGFFEFVQKLAFWENADEKRQAALLGGLEKLEDKAAKCFEAQYFELARKFEDFAVWANLQAHKDTKALIEDLSTYVKLHAKLSATSEKNIDIGFAHLRKAVLSIPETIRTEQATEIAESFNNHYQARINDPIIEEKEIEDEDVPRLSFPKICNAFIPQAFRVLRKAGKSRRLEDEATWNSLPRRGDLGAFLLSYLSSPYSTDTPLLILGHPGSGKSLLTTMLSAQLMSAQFTAIRVPLREVNADADIPTQIEEYVKHISGVSFDSWIKLRTLFKNCPPIVILDGYDELLQASGQVFASYIMEAQRFQQHQTEQGWPVRIIITSRVTLIDKATVPVGSTIIRLLEFDEYQRERWSSIWNECNAAYFHEAKIEKFALPAASEKGADKILNLAEQPLLLLMLALYDSEGNQLRTSQGLDRTKLYDSLLRRFVVRERGKEKGFNDVKTKEKNRALATEMQRLGVAALGMYNRRKVHILSAELDDDLAFFELEREVVAKSAKTLSQADLLLGSFFFVHKSKAQHSSGAEDTHEESSAFEFLHNTFGEFLTADFIIRRAVAQVEALQAAEASEALRSVMDKMMGTADGFERDWFASLVYTPLFTRPVILEMIREWAPHVLKEHGLSENDFVETLEMIVLNQIKRLLSKREMPQIMRKETAQEGYRVPFGDHPLLGHIAIYSINLVTLRLVSGKTPFNFDESEIASHEDGTRPWDRLMYIWRSWFSLGNLNGLTAVMVADRNENTIKLSAKNKFQAEEAAGRLQEFHNVALSLGDDLSACIAGLYLFDPANGSTKEVEKLDKKAHAEDIGLHMPVLLAKLQVFARNFEESPMRFFEHSRIILEQAIRIGRSDQIEFVCQLIVRTLDPFSLDQHRGSGYNREFQNVFDPSLVIELASRDPRSAMVIVEIGKRFYDFEWVSEFSERFLDYFMHKMPLFERETSGSPYGYSFEWLQLIKAIFGSGAFFSNVRYQKLSSKLLDRMLNPRRLLELRERDPEGALAYLQIFREFVGGRYFEKFFGRSIDRELIDRLFDPRHLLELSERNPEGALTYLQIFHELVGRSNFEEFIGRHMNPKLIEHLFHPRHLLELSERNPKGSLAYLKILRELGGKRYFEGFIGHHKTRKLIDRLFDLRHLLELSELNPEGALAYLQILRELGGGCYFEELIGHRMEPKLINRLLDRQRERFLQTERIESLGVWLALTRLFNAKMEFIKLDQVMTDLLMHRESFRTDISYLPITSLRDLRWLAEQTKSIGLLSLVDELTT